MSHSQLSFIVYFRPSKIMVGYVYRFLSLLAWSGVHCVLQQFLQDSTQCLAPRTSSVNMCPVSSFYRNRFGIPVLRSHSQYPGMPVLKALDWPLNEPTFRLRTLHGLASDLSMTWMSWSTSSPVGRGRVTSSATSLAASSSWRGRRAQAVGDRPGPVLQSSGICPTHQLQVLSWLLVQVVSQVLVKAGQVLHLHLDPVFPQVVMPLKFIPGVGSTGTECRRRNQC